MGPHPLDVVDDAIGGGLERLNQAVHRRRLRRRGQLAAMQPEGDGLWASTAGRPPRDGNTVEVLVDGATALPRIAEDLTGATRSVHIAGWHLNPDFRLTRGPGSPTLRELLAGLVARGVRVRVLLWAGPPRRSSNRIAPTYGASPPASPTAPGSAACSTPVSTRCTATTRRS